MTAMLQENRLALGRADTRMIEIDMDHRLVDDFAVDLGLAKSDQERPALQYRRNVTAVPALALLGQEQVLVFVETEQRECLQTTLVAAAKQNRILALDMNEFGRKDQRHVDVVAELGGEARADAQVLVSDIVERNGSGHGIWREQGVPRRAGHLSTSKLG